VARLSPAIRYTETADGHVLFDRHRGRMLCLNPVGSTILELALEGLQEEEIVSRIATEYVVDVRTARTDVREFLQSLCNHHIFEEGQPAVPRTDQ
jgi:hypothetical protein